MMAVQQLLYAMCAWTFAIVHLWKICLYTDYYIKVRAWAWA
jgi:hypothetical protein